MVPENNFIEEALDFWMNSLGSSLDMLFNCNFHSLLLGVNYGSPSHQHKLKKIHLLQQYFFYT